MANDGLNGESKAVDYAELEKALFNTAVGSERPDRVREQTVTRTTIDGSDKTVRMQHVVAVEPNTQLIKEMLSGRIGGPQDWC